MAESGLGVRRGGLRASAPFSISVAAAAGRRRAGFAGRSQVAVAQNESAYSRQFLLLRAYRAWPSDGGAAEKGNEPPPWNGDRHHGAPAR